MDIRYIVASPGRTGSIFVATTIARSLVYTIVYDSNLDLTVPPVNIRPVVFHTHNTKLQLDNDIVVIQPYRKSIFNAIISAVISEEYREWNIYSGNQQPFVASLPVFKEQYIWHKYWEQAFDQSTNYACKIKHCFEDFIGDSYSICKHLKIPLTQYDSLPSPYGNNIININELKEYYAELEKEFTTDIPQEFDEIHDRKITRNNHESK